jgi:nucleoid-associated protein YgaU
MSGAYLEHIVALNERWDHLAYRYYGDANRVSPIIRANRASFENALGPIPSLPPVGLVVKIPVLPEEPVTADLLPPWKRSVAP